MARYTSYSKMKYDVKHLRRNNDVLAKLIAENSAKKEYVRRREHELKILLSRKRPEFHHGEIEVTTTKERQQLQYVPE